MFEIETGKVDGSSGRRAPARGGPTVPSDQAPRNTPAERPRTRRWSTEASGLVRLRCWLMGHRTMLHDPRCLRCGQIEDRAWTWWSR